MPPPQIDVPASAEQTESLGVTTSSDSGWASVSASSRPATKPKWRVIFFLALVVAVGLGVYFGAGGLFSQQPDVNIQLYRVTRKSFPVLLKEKGELEAANSIDIRCELEGRSTIIYLIDEGAHVKKGDLLVELASDEIDEEIRETEIKEATARAAYEAAEKELEILQDENASEIRKASLNLTLAQLALEKYKEGEAADLQQDADLDVAKAKYVLQRAEADYKDSQELFKKNYVTRIELENDEFDVYTGNQELTKAELKKTVLEKYTIPMAMKEKGSDVEEAMKELARTKKSAQASEAKAKADLDSKKSEFGIVTDKLAKYRDQKKKAKITASAEGLVVYARTGSWHREDTRIESGVQVYERQSMIELPDTSSMKVVIRVHEAQTERLKLGLPATVEIEGFSGRQFTGKVSKIAVLADSTNRWLNPNLKQYETEILLDGKRADLKPGVTAHVEVLVAELKDVLAVPVQSVFGKAGK